MCNDSRIYEGATFLIKFRKKTFPWYSNFLRCTWIWSQRLHSLSLSFYPSFSISLFLSISSLPISLFYLLLSFFAVFPYIRFFSLFFFFQLQHIKLSIPFLSFLTLNNHNDYPCNSLATSITLVTSKQPWQPSNNHSNYNDYPGNALETSIATI